MCLFILCMSHVDPITSNACVCVYTHIKSIYIFLCIYTHVYLQIQVWPCNKWRALSGCSLHTGFVCSFSRVFLCWLWFSQWKQLQHPRPSACACCRMDALPGPCCGIICYPTRAAGTGSAWHACSSCSVFLSKKQKSQTSCDQCHCESEQAPARPRRSSALAREHLPPDTASVRGNDVV